MSAQIAPPSGFVLALPKFDNTVGALLVGCYVALLFYGVIAHQTYRYFQMFPNDKRFLKITIGSLWILDTIHSILIVHTSYYYLVTNFLNNFSLFTGVWQISITVTSLVTTAAQAFFARRIYQFSGNWFIAVAILITSIVRLGFTIATTTLSFTLVSFIRFEHFSWILSVSLASTIVADLGVTCSLCWFLHRSKTGFERTDSLIDKLLLYLINAGLFTILFNAVTLACAVAMRNNFIFLGLYFVISKLYLNSLLAVVNSRKGLLRRAENGSFELQELDVNLPADEQRMEIQHGEVIQLRRRGAGVVVSSLGLGNKSIITDTEDSASRRNDENIKVGTVGGGL